MRVNYYPTILLSIVVFHYHNSESVRQNSTKNWNLTSSDQISTVVTTAADSSANTNEYYLDENENGFRFKYFTAESKNDDDNLISSSWPEPEGGSSRHSRSLISRGHKSSGKELVKAAKAAGLILGGLGSKLIVKLFFGVLSKYPALLALPTLTSIYFLAGVLFGRLTAGIINPTTTTTTTPATATTTTTTTSTTTTTTTTTGPTGTVNFFFGTNLSGNGATVTGPIGVCEDFPAQADNMLQSFQLTTGTCIVICDGAGCTGMCYRITGGTTVNDLGSFNSMTSSFMFC